MMEGWKEYRLGDLLEKIIGGGTPSKSKPEYWDGNIFWCSVKDMVDGKLKISKTGDTITKLGLENSSTNLIKAGNLITSTRMGLGRAFINTVDMAINQDLKALIPNKKTTTEFLLWLLLVKKEELEGLGTGATVKGIRLETLKNIKIHLPPLPTQQRIAKILSAYDDLIENNLKRIKLLEEMAQRTYEEWFVRFKFPGHETTKFDKEKGLPEGWKKVRIKDLVRFSQGLQVPIEEQSLIQKKGFKRFIRIVDITQGGQEDRFVYSKNKRYEVDEDDLFMIRYGSPMPVIGYSGIIANNFFKIQINDNQQINTKYLFYFLSQKHITDYLLAISVSSTMPAISFNTFGHLIITLPEIFIQNYFEEYTNKLYKIIKGLKTQNLHLKQARDILLPRLMTGMIDVDEIRGRV